ncbi:MAG: anthranilate synthase component I family protein [Planctomycetota bacterium]
MIDPGTTLSPDPARADSARTTIASFRGTDPRWRGDFHAVDHASCCSDDPLAALRAALARSPAREWAIALPYELGHAIEPTASRGARPAIDLWQLEPAHAAEPPPPRAWSVEGVRSLQGRCAYLEAVRRAIAYTHVGDVFQANIAHVLRGTFCGDVRALFDTLVRTMTPDYGALLETPSRAVLSVSPELFLSFDARSRRVITRPIKGTRAGRARDLLDASKDRAELNMIIDLMRNDLGRVCEPGSVRVETARAVERHAGDGPGSIHHAVAQVAGTLREGRDLVDLLRAAFPAGSITGAPKVRAMQVINELEPFERGAYCGSIGRITADGSAVFSVGIRTATVTPCANTWSPGEPIERATIDFPVGAGIVADSDPDAEWSETLDKARAFLDAIGADGIEG